MKTSLIYLTVATLALSACANMEAPNSTTATHTGIGAAAGAAVGAAVTRGNNRLRGAAIGAAIGGAGAYLWSKHMQEQKAAMEQATQGTGVTVSQTEDNRLKLDIPSDISFDSGRYTVKSAMYPVLDRFATTLNQHQATRVTIIGHTDSSGSDAINNPLSINRAAAVRDYLVGRGVNINRITVDGRGSREPIADNASASGRARNRRVEIFVAENTGS